MASVDDLGFDSARAHIGRALADESELAKQQLRKLRGEVFRRRLGDILADHALAEVQLQVLQERAGPHHLRNVEQRIAAVHHRLDALEAELRVQAERHGLDAALPISRLRAELAAKTRSQS